MLILIRCGSSCHKLTLYNQLLSNLTGHLIHHVRMGKTVKQCVNQFPSLSMVSNIQPVTRSVLRVRLTITAEFDWNDKVHGGTSEPWWIWVEDPDNDHIYHYEYFLLLKKHVSCGDLLVLLLGLSIV